MSLSNLYMAEQVSATLVPWACLFVKYLLIVSLFLYFWLITFRRRFHHLNFVFTLSFTVFGGLLALFYLFFCLPFTISFIFVYFFLLFLFVINGWKIWVGSLANNGLNSFLARPLSWNERNWELPRCCFVRRIVSTNLCCVIFLVLVIWIIFISNIIF